MSSEVAFPGLNFFDVEFQNTTRFLSSVLLYHLAPGQWQISSFVGGAGNMVIPTMLQGRNLSFLEDNDPQVMACGIDINGIEIYNQQASTFVQASMQFQHVTIHVIGQVIGIPGTFSFLVGDAGLSSFVALKNASGVTDFDEQVGMTAFVPDDNAFAIANNETGPMDPSVLLNNHVSIYLVIMQICP